MNWENFHMILTFAVLGGVFPCFVKEWLPTDLGALGGLYVLLAFGVLNENDLRKIFSNQRLGFDIRRRRISLSAFHRLASVTG